jgi:hypothetical protein
VGPNNAGKSTLLREVHAAVGLEPSQILTLARVVASLELKVTGDESDAVAWLLQHGRLGRAGVGGEDVGLMPLTAGQQITHLWLSSVLPFQWGLAKTAARFGGAMRPFLVHYADTETRLQQSQAAQARNDAREVATHPLHALEDDRRRLTRASHLAEQVFGEPLHLDDYSAARRLKVGRLDVSAPTRDSDDGSYREALLALPELAEQGDGMRSFFGQLLPLLARTYPLVLVDEPEAFLHPPQAAQLGKALGDLVTENGVQLMLATHDRHLLSGLLESGVELSVVRIDRHRKAALAQQLSAAELHAVWSDPAVRYSNALDGLFHRLVILVEGDGDARFYAASLDAAAEQCDLPLAPSDVLFVPCNGKGGMAKLARALVGLGVPVVASPDLDILQKTGELRALLEALGGKWSDVAANHTAAVAGTVKKATPLLISDLVRALPTDQNAPLDEDVRELVRRLLGTAGGGWAAIKTAGIGALGGGGAGAAAAQLLESLDRTGLVAVREGELESFDHALGAGKTHWVAAALEAGVHKRIGPVTHIRRLIASGLQR